MTPLAAQANDLLDAVGTLHVPARGEVRILSLVPSLTELLCELGLRDRLVGRTGFCIHPRAALRDVPKVGGTKDVKLDAIAALAPTHLVVNIDENRRETVEALADIVPNIIVTHPCVPQDNIALYRLFGAVFRCERRAGELETQLRNALDEAAQVAASLPAESVLYLIWREPWMTVARDTYISAMLAAVGWSSAPDRAGGAAGAARYPVVDWNDPWLAGVERVLLSSEPYRFREPHVHEVRALCALPTMLIDGEMASWYGSRVIEGLRYLAAMRREIVRE